MACDVWAVPSDAARAVGLFHPDGPLGYRAAGISDAPLRSTRAEAERDWHDARCTCPTDAEIDAAIAATYYRPAKPKGESDA